MRKIFVSVAILLFGGILAAAQQNSMSDEGGAVMALKMPGIMLWKQKTPRR